MTVLNFNQKKFQSLPVEQQHKKCAEFLRYIYDKILISQPFQSELDHFHELNQWMNVPLLNSFDIKSIADRYHYHLQEAKVNIRENNLLPRVTTIDRPQPKTPFSIAIYLDRIRSAFNVGSILRTTEAFALGSIYFSDSTPFVSNRQVQNTSMDAYRWIPCHQNVALENLPRPIIALETSPDGISLHDFIFPDNFTLVLGNEEYGCSESTLKIADYIVQIPLRGRKNSLNVANAFAIAAAEIQRQKKFYQEIS